MEIWDNYRSVIFWPLYAKYPTLTKCCGTMIDSNGQKYFSIPHGNRMIGVLPTDIMGLGVLDGKEHHLSNSGHA